LTVSGHLCLCQIISSIDLFTPFSLITHQPQNDRDFAGSMTKSYENGA
jgi:hypothetical protein